MSGQAFGEGFLEEAALELGLGGWLTVEVGAERKGMTARGRKEAEE